MSKAARHKPRYSIGDLTYRVESDEYFLIEDITVDMMGQEWYHVRDLSDSSTCTFSCYTFDHNGIVKKA
jgi:hypothetical protein